MATVWVAVLRLAMVISSGEADCTASDKALSLVKIQRQAAAAAAAAARCR